MTRGARRAASMAVGALLLFGCATNPVTGKKELSLVSSDQELLMGKEAYPTVIAEYGAYDHQGLAAYVDSVGKALARVSHLPDLEWKFTLLDDPTVNAFAMPGGYIYITRGIMAHLNSEAQLAGVLGHEIGHVTARHSAKRITQQQLGGAGLGLASVFIKGFGRHSEVAQQALGMMFLKYGRDDENQSDQLGVDYSVKAGYDPREIPSTYAMLKRVSDKAGQRLPSFLSTHPDPGDREVRTTQLAQTAAAGKTNLIVRQQGYLRRLDGMVFGVDPRQGYFEGTRFFHPELRFEMQFPSGWKVANTRQAVLAADPNQQANMQLTLANAGDLSPAAFVAELQRSGRVTEARGGEETIGGFPAWVGALIAPRQDGTSAQLVAAFIRRAKDQMFQVVGAAAAGSGLESRIAESARSFRTLTDPARLQVAPNRLQVAAVSQAGTFEEMVARQKSLAIELDDLAILNNVDAGDEVRRGELVKLVVPGKR